MPVIGAILTLAGGWLIGQRVSDRWERMKKQRELDLAALANLYGAYGEFYAVWKAWNSLAAARLSAPADARWVLLERATAAEGAIEAILIKIATERILTSAQVEALGALRQSYRGLRYAIQDDKPLAWDYSAHPDYTAFKGLQTHIAGLLTQNQGDRPTSCLAARNFARATANVYEQTWPDMAIKSNVYYPDGKDATDLNRPLLRDWQSGR